jgi:hypothetical protein
VVYHKDVGRHSAFGIATELWVGGFGDRIPGERVFPHPSRPALGPVSFLCHACSVILRGKRLVRGVTTPPI